MFSNLGASAEGGAVQVARMAVRGRTMSFNEETVGKFVAQESKHRIFKLMLCLLYDRSDWSAKDWQVVQVIPSHRLLDDRLRVQGVQPEEIGSYQSWSSRLANHVILSDAEAKDYYSMDLEDWVRSRPAEFWRRHHLPDDPALYEEFSFLEFIQARRSLIARRLQKVLLDDQPESDPALSPAASLFPVTAVGP